MCKYEHIHNYNSSINFPCVVNSTANNKSFTYTNVPNRSSSDLLVTDKTNTT